jgi:hypothetical protein
MTKDTKFEFTFTLSGRIWDVEKLYQAAVASFLAENDGDNEPDDYLKDLNGEININACLVQILDPARIEGCDIHDSSAVHGDNP